MNKHIKPAEAVRACCKECLGAMNFDRKAIERCQGNTIGCVLYDYRLGGKRVPVRIFRKYCVKDCMYGCSRLVNDCVVETCPMHSFRFGSNPSLIGRIPRGITSMIIGSKGGSSQGDLRVKLNFIVH